MADDEIYNRRAHYHSRPSPNTTATSKTTSAVIELTSTSKAKLTKILSPLSITTNNTVDNNYDKDKTTTTSLDDDSMDDTTMIPLVSGSNTTTPRGKEYHPHPHNRVPVAGSANTAQMVVNIIISFVGAGLLGQPHAFSKSGWLLGSISLLLTSALNVYAMLRLPMVQEELYKQQQLQQLQSHNTLLVHKNNVNNHNETNTDSDEDEDDTTTSKAILPVASTSTSTSTSTPSTTLPMAITYSDLGRLLLGSHYGERLVQVCLGISQAGFATAYIIFIAANLYNIAQWSRFWVCLGCIPGLAVLVQFQDMGSLSPFSLLANVANFGALTAVLVQDWESYHHHQPQSQQQPQQSHSTTATTANEIIPIDDADTIQAIKWSGFLYVIAITIYSMEGAGMILSLKASYSKPQQFGWLLSITIGLVSLFMALFGAAGYCAFGTFTLAPITLNLTNHWSATFVKLALCLGLYLTYPIMMFPLWSILEGGTGSTGTGGSLSASSARATGTLPNAHPHHATTTTSTTATTTTLRRRSRMGTRIGVVCASAAVAYSVPNFGKFLSLVGSSICTLLGFVLPCYFHIKVRGKDLSWWQYGLDVFLVVGGSLFGILGTFQSLVAMMHGELDGE